VERAFAAVEEANALLVAGTKLATPVTTGKLGAKPAGKLGAGSQPAGKLGTKPAGKLGGAGSQPAKPAAGSQPVKPGTR
jgi:hypothetical protein